MYEVILSSDANNPGARRALPRGLTFGPFKGFKIEPTDELCNWLNLYGMSLVSIEMITRSGWVGNQDVIGLRFSFSDVGEAILFKLTWI